MQKLKVKNWWGLILGIPILTFFLISTYLLWQNNKTVLHPEKSQLQKSYDLGIFWLLNHKNEILAENNPMLWWMLDESTKFKNNPSLEILVAQYKERHIDPSSGNPWAYLFSTKMHTHLTLDQLDSLPDYNIFFLYGLSCDASLEKEEVIKQQLEFEFCDEHHPISPACITHQLMGIRFMQRRHCGEEHLSQQLIGKLQDRIITQMTWDIRVVDVYLQRVLMLVDSGALNRVKPVWITNILNAQNKDGGWSDFQPLVHTGNNFALGFSSSIVGFRQEKASFHATAQGVLLMSMLLSR